MPESALRVTSFNMQAGIGSHRPRHVFTHGWRYVLPHRATLENLQRIADAIRDSDLVGLQEADAGSYRSRFIHQQDFLAMQAGFPFSRSLVTREISPMARISLGLLSRIPIAYCCEHRLPGSRHGRGAIEAAISWQGRSIAVINTHLSLQQHSRMRQMRYLSTLINRHASVILMGDFNCAPDSREMNLLLNHTRLHLSETEIPASFPSWSPVRRLDHILVTGDLEIDNLRALPLACSDHLPVTADIRLRRTSKR